MGERTLQLNQTPPPLTEPYQKARRSYVLASGLLIAWELIGFEVDKVPIESAHITLKSPQAIPWALMALIVYFLLRLLQEWYQCDVARREHGWALMDFYLSHVIAAFALAIYGTQRLLEVQLANAPQAHTALVFAIFFLLGVFALIIFWLREQLSWLGKITITVLGVVGSVFLYRGGTSFELPIIVYTLGCMISFVSGAATSALYRLVLLRETKKRRNAHGAERSE